jgi:hypothetical protein
MPENESIRILSPSMGEKEPPRNFYIWSYQPHFATTLKVAADSLFRELNLKADQRSFIVAINIKDGDKNPAAVVEPEDETPCSEDFANVIELTRQLEKVKPGVIYGWQTDDEEKGKAWADREQHREHCALVRLAVKQTIKEYFAYAKRRVYVSHFRQVGPYLLFSVITISQDAFEVYPHLRCTERGGHPVTVSLIDAACDSLLEKCRDAILSSIDGDGFAEIPTAPEILRDAGAKFMYTPFGACDEIHGLHGGFHACNEISTLTYEKSVGLGRLILCKSDHRNVHRTLELASPPVLRNFRSTRKLLELARGDEALISDSHVVSGVGHAVEGYDPGNEDLFTVEFVGHAKWRLVHSGVTLMVVEHGMPQLPQQQLQIAEFVDSYARVFADDAAKHSLSVRRLAQKAANLNHGTIIIISNEAEEEAKRFAAQATAIEPQKLTEDLLERAARIDGAILIAPDATCYAIGVILDGVAIDKGSSFRGSRFNSTLRYVYGRPSNSTLGVVISDDGMVDVIPEHRPVIGKRELRSQIDRLSEQANAESFDHKSFKRTMEWIREHRFYLSADQCSEVNAIRDKYNELPDVGRGARNVFSDLAPTPEMNESYLSD